MIAWGQPEVEYSNAVRLDHRAELRSQKLVQSRIAIKPPEGRPPEDNEARSRLAKPLQFTNCGFIILRIPPVLPMPFEKRDGWTAGLAHSHSSWSTRMKVSPGGTAAAISCIA